MFAKIKSGSVIRINGKIRDWPGDLRGDTRKEALRAIFTVSKYYRNRRCELTSTFIEGIVTCSHDCLDVIKRISK